MLDQRKELAQGLVEVGAILRGGAVQVGQGQIAQVLQAVAAGVDVAGVDRHVAQLRARLDVEQEDQPVDQAHTFGAELARIERFDGAGIAEAVVLDQLSGGLVAELLDGLAQGVFQVRADAGVVLVGFGVEAIQQAALLGVCARTRTEGVAMQQRDTGIQRGRQATTEDLAEIEAQDAVAGPLEAVDQHPLQLTDQQHEARRMIGREQVAREQLGERAGAALVLPEIGRRQFLDAQVLGAEGALQRVGDGIIRTHLLRRIEGRDDDQLGQAGQSRTGTRTGNRTRTGAISWAYPAADGGPDRERLAGVPFQLVRVERIAKCPEQALMQAAVPLQSRGEELIGIRRGSPCPCPCICSCRSGIGCQHGCRGIAGMVLKECLGQA